MPALDRLIDRLGVPWSDQRLLESALAHSSFLHEHPDEALRLVSGERLEFLGDSVLNFLAADRVFARFPQASEGDLTALRVALIKTATLATFARELGLGAYVRISKGEEQSGARMRSSLLADTFEAVLAAVYLDGGLDAARELLLPLIDRQLDQIAANGLVHDYKSLLQRRVQAAYNQTPVYQIIAQSGPEHRREYTVAVLLGEQQLGTGQGVGKQAATQEAARSALEQLDTPAPGP